jgi:hypothetical protein
MPVADILLAKSDNLFPVWGIRLRTDQTRLPLMHLFRTLREKGA